MQFNRDKVCYSEETTQEMRNEQVKNTSAKKDPTATLDHKMTVRQYHNTIRGKNKQK